MVPLVQCCVPAAAGGDGIWVSEPGQSHRSILLVLPQHPELLDVVVKEQVLTFSSCCLLTDLLSIHFSNSLLSLLILSASTVSCGGKLQTFKTPVVQSNFFKFQSSFVLVLLSDVLVLVFQNLRNSISQFSLLLLFVWLVLFFIFFCMEFAFLEFHYSDKLSIICRSVHLTAHPLLAVIDSDAK